MAVEEKTKTVADVLDKALDKTTDVFSAVSDYAQAHAGQAFDVAAQAVQVHSIVEICINIAFLVILIIAITVAVKTIRFLWIKSGKDNDAKVFITVFGGGGSLVIAIGIAVMIGKTLNTGLWLGAIAPKAQLIYQIIDKVQK